MQILKETGTVWHERRSISKFYVNRSVKMQLEQREISVKIGRGVRHQFCSTCREIALPRKLSKDLETSR
jgi:hypothetical protein